MKVSELIEALEAFDANLQVEFFYMTGDRNITVPVMHVEYDTNNKDEKIVLLEGRQ